MSKDQHVLPDGDGWIVKAEGASAPSSRHVKQEDAIRAARKVAQEQESELIIHASDGTIREKDSHGRDPFPPRG